MVKLLHIIILIGFAVGTIGQNSTLQFKSVDEKYDWRTSTYNKFDSIYFGLPTVKFSKYKTHIRISLTGQVLDLFSNDSNNFQGVLTNYTREYTLEKNKASGYEETKVSQYVFQKVSLDSNLSTKVALQILSTKQDTISMEAIVKTWEKNFLHCEGLLFEFNRNQTYKQQIFWCPWGQKDSIIFKKTILANHDFVSKELSLEEKYDEFKSVLPRGKTYSRDGYAMMHVLSDKENEAWQKDKPNWEYMESIKDTLNKYLSDTLTKIFKAKGEVECYNQFFLRFSKKGKLKKITTNGKFSDLADRIEYYMCKRKIRKAFRKVRVDFIKPKRGYFKELNFVDHGVMILQ